jgi:O-6-methylguanine DNA methyltransferase
MHEAPYCACELQTPLGGLGLVASTERLLSVQFLNGMPFQQAIGILSEKFQAQIARENHAILKKAVDELQRYFEGKLRQFSLPLNPTGRSFQQKVWRELRSIPYGATCSYHGIAKAIGNAHAARAVGQACNANPIAIIIPCHRVVGRKGDPSGYRGGVLNKLKLLEFERRLLQELPEQVRRQRVWDELA